MGFFDNWLKKTMQAQIEEMTKATADDIPEQKMEEPTQGKEIGRQAIIDDPYFQHVSHDTVIQSKLSRISNKVLKDTSLRDWLVSAIIQNRTDTLLRFSREQKAKFDMGYRFVLRDKNAEYTPEDHQIISALSSFIYHCGREEGTPIDDKMNFGEFLKLVVRDMLTFGHLAIEKVNTRGGALHRFRPLPAEQMFLINKNMSRDTIEKELEAMEWVKKPLSDNDPRGDQQVNKPDIDKYKYVQFSYDNRPLSVFGDEDMIFKLFNPQNFADSLGYCYGPLELAIINIMNHLNAENYNANFFTHGYAARGVLHLKGTVTQTQLTAFRRQFYNSIIGTNNAWRTPIIAGLEEVEWVPMSASARDMEYMNFNNHLMRAICTQFQIDPYELGLDMLTTGTGRTTGGGQQAGKQRIEYSRERGLYPIIMFIEDLINCDILPLVNPEWAKKYQFVFDGYTDETPQTAIALEQAEMTVHASMNDLLTKARKDKIKETSANLPLNQAFWALIEKNYTRGEIRERFFGDVGASQRRELQYIPGDGAFIAWNQLLVSIEQQKKQQNAQQQQLQMQEKEMEHEQQMKQEENQRNDAEHQAAMTNHQAAQAAAVVGSLHDAASQIGARAATKASNVGGKPIKNPINS